LNNTGEYRYARQDELIKLKKDGWRPVNWMHCVNHFAGISDHLLSVVMFKPKRKTVGSPCNIEKGHKNVKQPKT
jgi:hypothetical protein